MRFLSEEGAGPLGLLWHPLRYVDRSRPARLGRRASRIPDTRHSSAPIGCLVLGLEPVDRGDDRIKFRRIGVEDRVDDEARELFEAGHCAAAARA
jgi:hypothetical protein